MGDMVWKRVVRGDMTMTDGVPNGPSKRYKDGFLLFEGNLKDGKEDGLWKFFNEDGTLKDTKTYKDGMLLKWNTLHTQPNLFPLPILLQFCPILDGFKGTITGRILGTIMLYLGTNIIFSCLKTMV